MAENSALRTPTEIFGRQRAIYAKLLGMSERQVELVKQTKTDELLSLLAEKRTVLGELAELQERLSPVHPQWEEVMSALSEEERMELRRIAEEIARLLETILRLDEQGRDELRHLRDATLSQLKRIGDGKRVVETYRRKEPDPGVKFFDKTS